MTLFGRIRIDYSGHYLASKRIRVEYSVHPYFRFNYYQHLMDSSQAWMCPQFQEACRTAHTRALAPQMLHCLCAHYDCLWYSMKSLECNALQWAYMLHRKQRVIHQRLLVGSLYTVMCFDHHAMACCCLCSLVVASRSSLWPWLLSVSLHIVLFCLSWLTLSAI